MVQAIWISSDTSVEPSMIFSLSDLTCKFFHCSGKKKCYIKRQEVVPVNQVIILLSTYYYFSIPELCNPTILPWTFYRAYESHFKSSKPMAGKWDSPDHSSFTVEGTRESQQFKLRLCCFLVVLLWDKLWITSVPWETTKHSQENNVRFAECLWEPSKLRSEGA